MSGSIESNMGEQYQEEAIKSAPNLEQAIHVVIAQTEATRDWYFAKRREAEAAGSQDDAVRYGGAGWAMLNVLRRLRLAVAASREGQG